MKAVAEGQRLQVRTHARLYHTLLLRVGHRNGGNSSTTFTRRPVEGGNEDSCAPCFSIASRTSKALFDPPSVNLRDLCKEGRWNEALNILDLMDQQGVPAYPGTYVCLLQACINMKTLAEGKRVHMHIVKSGLRRNIFLGNALVNMYAKCGSLVDARRVFDEMPERNVVSWTLMIGTYARHGHAEEAFRFFWEMQQGGLKPDKVTYIGILKACASLSALEQGYAQHGHGQDAFKIFQRMQHKGLTPDKFTFVSILDVCASLTSLERGKKIHADLIRRGFESDVVVGSTLVNMYAKCGCLMDARAMFDKMHSRNLVTWTAMISGYVHHGQCAEALKLFGQMQREGVKPDKVSLGAVLDACASITALKEGKQIHSHIIKSGFKLDAFLGNTLINMYAKCGSMDRACQVFERIPRRDVVSWNVLIGGFVQHGRGEKVFEAFAQMQKENVKPDEVTVIGVLSACASLDDLEKGKQIHAHIIRNGFDSDVTVCNTLINMYSKCGSLDDARQVFSKMPKRDVVSWNTMITGYVKHGHAEKVLETFWQMQQERLKPDRVTFINVLSACGRVAALELGKQVHAIIFRCGFESDLFVGSTLVNMYAKCGCVEHARQVFNRMTNRDVVSWNAMIAGYAQHGDGEKAINFFEQMQQEGFKPSVITFVGVLSACSHSGLVAEGQSYFYSMSQDHGITPTSEHYACMIDLLGRAGCLEEAEGFVQKMPFRPSAVVWMALLGAARIHGDVELAERAAKCILDLEPQSTAALCY